MKVLNAKSLVLAGSLCLAANSLHSEDIDLYASYGADALLPNVLFVFDNAAAFSASVGGFTCNYPASQGGGTPSLNGTAAGIQQCALVNAIAAIPDNTVNIGLMVYNDSGMTGSPVVLAGTGASTTLSCQSSQNGGCLVQPLAKMDQGSKQRLIDFIKSWKDSGQSDVTSFNIKANAGKTGAVMQEAWAYFKGSTGLSTRNYSGVAPTAGCHQNYVIFIGNAVGPAGSPQDGGNADVPGSLQTAGATAAQQQIITTTYPPGETCNPINNPYSMPPHNASSGLYADEWARFMKQSDLYPGINDLQSITTYTIGVLDPATCKADWPAQLTSMALVGGGEYFPTTDYEKLALAIATILNKIQAVNSAFASASLPLSVNTQGTFLNQIFIGQFRPDADGRPRWLGNLKQYQFGVDANFNIFLADADGKPAIAGAAPGETESGFISVEARSFWTRKDLSSLPDNLDSPTNLRGGYWINNPQGFAGGYDSPDGNIVEKGGVAQQIRMENLQTNYVTSPDGPRRLFTCVGSDCTGNALLSTMPFATTNANLTATTLGITNPVFFSNVASISRNSGTGIVTVNLTVAPSPAIADPTTVIISGSAGGQFDYSLAGQVAAASGTTVTYNLPLETPPMTASSGFTAAKVDGGTMGISGVSSLTRTGNAGLITVTATLADPTFGGGAPVAAGDLINITNAADGYNGSGYSVLNVNGSDITFAVNDSPTVYGGGGQIWVGTTCQTTGAPSSRNCDSIGASNSNPPGTSPPPGLVRGTNCPGCTGVSGTSPILMVNFPAGTERNFPLGATAKISGTTPSGYNSAAGYQIVGVGNLCSVTVTDPASGLMRTYTGTASVTGATYSICLDLGTPGSGFALTPALGANGASGSTEASRPNPGAAKTITSMSRGNASCPTSNLATVTATAAAHGFAVGDKIIVGNPAPGSGEAAYNGTFGVLTTPTANTFTFEVATAPACTDNTAGMKISYQSTAGGVSATDLIRWVRGADNVGDEKSPGSGITIRPSIHGDVLHSRPTVIAYPDGNIVVFYGGNDGVFRAINGNNKEDGTGSIAGVVPGGELWGFVASEFYSKLQRLYFNDPPVKLYNTPTTLFPNPQPKDYFFDGGIGVFQDPAANKAFIFLSARRGGRLIYAIDVSNPAAPRFMWKKGCPNLDNNTGCDSGFEELGQTWSQPKPALVKGYVDTNGDPKPVLIFAAGHDANQDGEAPLAGPALPPDTMGRGIFVLDALDGSIVWRAGPGGSSGTTCKGNPCLVQDMVYSMPSDVTLLDRSPDGLIDRFYVPDLGGNVWRVDLELATGNTPANWQVSKFAALGGTGFTKRKIFFAPDVVTTKSFDAVMVGTGDREHPVEAQLAVNIVNRFYMLKDIRVGSDACDPACPATIVDNTDNLQDIQPAAANGSSVLFNSTPPPDGSAVTPYDGSGSGFYITMLSLTKNADGTFGPGMAKGEKVVNAPTTVGGRTFFGTNMPITPDPTLCLANLGLARGYSFDIITGAVSVVEFAGGGLPPSPVSGLVAIDIGDGQTVTIPFLIGGGNPDPTCTGPDCKSALGGLKPPIPIVPTRTRTYWYREHDRR